MENGFQVAFMAPTEILAEQHLITLTRWLGATRHRVALLSGKITAAERRTLLPAIERGDIHLVVGTHALVQEQVKFRALALAVIDEQHRFGVLQRGMLATKGLHPDVLVMTATPIPRTLALTECGDMEVSIIRDLPPGRKPVRTLVKPDSRRDDVYQLVRQEVQEGRQAYVIYPLVEESEKIDLKAATAMAEHLARDIFPDLSVALLHGRMKADEKERVMRAFAAGTLHILVATTVVEVGVDVPNATVMVILDADRFRIAQLHQLRGRVGRGEHPSTCWLVTQPGDDSDAPSSNPRVEALVASTDGFALAEVDLDLRGEGTLMSTAQKGRNDLKLASLRRDRELVQLAREAAFEIVDADPSLAGNPLLADELDLLLTADDEAFLAKS
jgi:ATP-dependent DNA helicase RecG